MHGRLSANSSLNKALVYNDCVDVLLAFPISRPQPAGAGDEPNALEAERVP